MVAKTYHKLFEKYGSEPCREIIERIDTEIKWMLKKDYLDGVMRLDKFISDCKTWGEPYVATRTTPSSLVLNLLGITACNPLPSHYYCSNCKKVEFIDTYDGFALLKKVCDCGGMMQGDGHNIPVEQFCKKTVKNPLAFHLSEKAYKRLPEYFEDFREEPYAEDVIGIEKFFTEEEKVQIKKDRSIPIKATNIEWLCYIGRCEKCHPHSQG